MKYTKDEEARAERSSVKMWPGITAGIIIGLIAYELTAKGENPTASKAVDAGLAASGSTAKRYLARIRREHSERF